jgi:hypothetical protein
VIGDDGKQFVKGLLNRNPQNRLGAKRGAAELKEHPFFKSINWDLLAKKQITPPFKPIVDSDESTANFDPEFTNSSLADAGINPYEDDGYEAPDAQPGKHSYVGPGGSLANQSHMGNAGVAISKPQRPTPTVMQGSPLTSSIQENFRGFTYTGESLMVSWVHIVWYKGTSHSPGLCFGRLEIIHTMLMHCLARFAPRRR